MTIDVSEYSETVVLLSHRVVSKVLVCSMLGLDNSHFWNIRLDLGGITIFEYEGCRYKLIKHTDTSHLSRIKQHPLNDF
ncbi:histidine phosphatase family protein [Chloroflexota bacterium]